MTNNRQCWTTLNDSDEQNYVQIPRIQGVVAGGSGQPPLTPFSHHTSRDNGHGGIAAPAALLMTNPHVKFLKR